jgi:hypothetical protein
LLLLTVLIERGRGSPLVGQTIADVIERADELAELLAMYWRDGKRPLSAQLKRGLALAFPKFDGYQLAKYNRDNAIKLRDVMFLCHPRPENEAQAATWKQLVDKTLPAPDTWEVALSAGGNTADTWTRLLTEGRLGGLALLRNLRNMKEAGVSDAVIREQLARAPLFDRVLPFRFIAAAIHAPHLEDALEVAMLKAAKTLPSLPGHTVLLIDHSASMNGVVSGRSAMTRFDAASALAILLREIGERVSIYAFSDGCVRVPARRGFALRDAIAKSVVASATFLGTAKRFVDTDAGPYDRIIVVTDEQSADQPDSPLGIARGYIVNVASYRTGIGYGRWVHIDGFSENLVRFIAAHEQQGPVTEDSLT